VRHLNVMLALSLFGGMALAAAQQPEPEGPDRRVTPEQLAERLEKGEVFFLDVREPEEIEELGTLAGYVNIPIGELEKRLNELPKDKPIITA
jgi:hypothetical protein